MERREKGEKGEGKIKNHGDQGKNHKTKPIIPKQEDDPKLNEEIKPKGGLLHHYGMNLWRGGSPSCLKIPCGREAPILAKALVALLFIWRICRGS